MLVLSLPPKIAEFRPLWESATSPFDLQGFALQGVEGRQLNKQMSKVAEHWRETKISRAMPPVQEKAFRRFPFEKVKTIRVRYLPAKPLPPRPFNFDDFDEE